MKRLKVLSIDWDYFIDATAGERAVMFPDGGNENLSAAICNYIWAVRYVDNEKLAEVPLDGAALGRVKNLLKSTIGKGTHIVVADSHKHMYKEVLSLFRNLSHEVVDLWNIDFHHDVYNMDNPVGVDCGNWLGLLSHASDPQSTFHWIGRGDSDIGGNKSGDSTVLDRFPWLELSTISEIPNEEPFDLVFLCRSGMWSPPHLDNSFLSLTRFLKRLKLKASGNLTPHPISTLEDCNNRFDRNMKYTIKEQLEIRKGFKNFMSQLK